MRSLGSVLGAVVPTGGTLKFGLLACMAGGALWAWSHAGARVEAGGLRSICSPAGVWIVSNNFGQENLLTVTPLDLFGQQYGIVASTSAGGNPSTGGFPEAVAQTPWHGIMVRTGRRTFDMTMYRVTQDVDRHKVNTQINFNEVEFSADCASVAAAGTFEIRDATGVTQVCAPVTTVGERLTLAEPCTELPPLPAY